MCMESIDAALQELGERWGYVVVTHRPNQDGDFRWQVANHTDEGLGPGENHEARGDTLEDAVQNALDGVFYR